MRIIYLSGPHHSDKSAYLTHKLSEALQASKELVCLLPSIEHVRFQKQQVAQRLGGLPPGMTFWGTFLAFAHHLLTYHQRYFKPMAKAEEWLKIYLLLRQVLPDKECQPGRVTLVQQLFSEWRESGLDSSELQALCSSQDLDHLNLYLNVYSQMRRDCWAINRGAPADILVQAKEILKGQSPYHGDVLSIDGFYEFNPLQVQLLQALIPRFDTIYFTCNYLESHPVYRYSQNFPLLFGAGEVVEFAPSPRNYFTQIQTGLFTNPIPSNPESLPLPTIWQNRWSDVQLKIVRCPNRRSEVAVAARTIKRWVHNGLEPTRIGVVFRQESCYRPLIEHIFPQFGIPLPPIQPLLSATEPAQILLRIIDINRNNYARHLLLDLLRLPAFSRYYGQYLINSFESHSATIGIAFSPTTWLKRFRDQLSYFQWAITQKTEDDNRRGEQYQIDQIQRLISFLENLFPDITLPEQITLPQLSHKINSLWERYNLKSTDFHAILQINNLIDDLIRLAPVDWNFSLNELSSILQKALNHPLNPTSAHKPGEIFVGELMTARGFYFEGLIVLGMVDGEFPARHTFNPLFNQTARKAGNTLLQRPIFKTEANLLEEKFLFHLLIGRTSRYLLVSYPNMDSNNKELPVSPFVTELLSAADAIKTAEPNQYSYEFLPPENVFTSHENVASREDLLNLHYAGGKNINDIEHYIDPRILSTVERQLVIQQHRQETQEGEYAGLLADSNWQYPQSQNKITITKLENYLRCPFYYLCTHVWQVPTIEEPTLDLDARLVGILIHKVLEALVNPFIRQPDRWREFLQSPSDNWLNRVDEILKGERARLNFISEPLWQHLRNLILTGVEKFIAAETKELAKGYFPEELEKSITITNAPFCEVTQAPFNFFILSGKIDRIDRNPATNQYLVLDYKRTGKSEREIIRDAKEGRHIQIPLYLITLPLGDPGYQHYSVGGGWYYSFEKGKRLKGFSLDADAPNHSSDWEATVDIVTATVKKVLQNMVNGAFLLKPQRPQDCKPSHCAYYDLCRYESLSAPISAEEENGEQPNE